MAQVTPESFIDYGLAASPDFLLAVSDEPMHQKPGRNRLEKSVRRSLKWLERLVEATRVIAGFILYPCFYA
jgi:queuine/archaeosine tRNA-ribosyltransferase